MNLRKEMTDHIQGCNKFLDDMYLQQFSTEQLLGLCHPIYREAYAYKLKKQ